MFGHDDHHDENDNPQENHHHDDSWQHPGPPPSDGDLDNDSGSDDHKDGNDNPAPGFSISQGDNGSDHDDSSHDSSPSITPSPISPSNGPADHGIGGADNDLIDLKQEALTKLSPLVGHLDQSPDEKFRTLMMMIQASDDQRLVREAYETALKITDEKERAQALLDIVNEINYFTHNSES